MRRPAVRYVKLSQNCGLLISALSLGTWHLPRLPERDEAGAFKVDVDEFRRVLRLPSGGTLTLRASTTGPSPFIE
ncbi:MAG: hypothetical protein LM571_04180 [Desulfurococcaceae archaeon]|jgi:hypothetical protein|nr:hypothetical protein [Desulfurococcaceae archaeon]